MADQSLAIRCAVFMFALLAGCNRTTTPMAPAVVPIPVVEEAPPLSPQENLPIAVPDEPEDGLPRPSESAGDGLGNPSSEDVPAAEATVSDNSSTSSERLLAFLPAGPLVIELRMTIDGEPYRTARGVLIDEALKLADRDNDGQPTWSEVYSDPKRTFLQRFELSTNGMTSKEFLKLHDTNQNGLVDRDEARRLVARAKNAGAAFSVENSSEYGHSNQRRSIVRAMLDADGDDVLGRAELEAAAERLLARDANDDHIVAWTELDDSLAGDEQAMDMRMNAYLNHPAALALGDRAEWDAIAYTLAEEYLNAAGSLDGGSLDGAFSLAPGLARALDDDGDGELTYEELKRLNVVEAQIVIAANFGRPGEQVAGVSLISLSPELGPADKLVSHTPRGLVIAIQDYRLQMVIDDRGPADEAGPSPEEQLAMFDKNKDGYLEKDEVAEVSPEAAAMFDKWDANGDGKIYLDELTAYRRSQQAPQFSAIRVVAGDDQDVLFPLLDTNQDGRLTARELNAAAQSLLTLDADGDGRISLDELPGGMTMLLTRGLPSNMSPLRSRLAVPPPPAASGPAWFVQMDANRDQEVTLDEFPGSADKFRSLDADGDGFVSVSEALAATTAEPAP